MKPYECHVYYNNKGACSPCPANCISCNQNECTQYSNSFVLVGATVQDYSTGVNYQSVCDPGCAVCTENPIFC